MRMSPWALCLSLWLIVSSSALYADSLAQLEVGIRFQALVDNSKLSQPVINAIVQDRDGFIWIATDDGLNRYDGHDMVVYRPSFQQHGSISHFVVKSLAVDNDGQLWVGTENGLDRYIAEYDRFERFLLDSKDKAIRALFVDSNNQVWVGNKTTGVTVIGADRQSQQKMQVQDPRLKGQSMLVHDFVEVDNKAVFVATRRGLFKADIAANSLQLTADTVNKNITQVASNGDGELLLGRSKGLFKFRQGSQHIEPVLPQQLHNKHIVALTRFGQQWFVGTRSNGLYLIDLDNQSFRHFKSDPSDKYALTDNQIDSLYQTVDGMFWVGTNNGINVFDPLQTRFGHISVAKEHLDCLSGNTIYAILLDKLNRLWIGAYGHGLNRIDLTNGHCELFSGIGVAEDSQLFKDVVALNEDNNGNVWIGTYNDGVAVYDSQRGRFFSFAALVESEVAALPKSVQAIDSDAQGSVWIATYDAGIFRFDTDGVLYNFLPQMADGSTVKEINDIAVDAQGTVWVASALNGLWRFNRHDNSFERIDGIAKRLWSVNFDRQNHLWIGTAGKGAMNFQPQSGEITHYSLENGLLSNVVLNIRQDQTGDMWLYTDKGLSRLNVASGDIRTFVEKDGLQGDSFTTAGFFDAKSQLLWTGGVNGFNRFAPKDIKPFIIEQAVKLTRFELFYKPMAVDGQQADSPLSKVVNHTDELTLDYRQNVFAFGFTALEYADAEKTKFAFKLDGYDDNWNIVDAERRYANYTNIDPGDYTFRVKATNRDGYWSSKETAVTVHIAPPWWSTKPALIGYLLSLWLLVYLFVSFRTRSLRKRAKVLELAVLKRTEELADEKQKVELLLDRKNEEFATVSHEFRTPLTLILGPLAQLLKVSTDPQQQSRLSSIERNGYRLLRMVDQLLNMETFRVKAINQKQTQPSGQIIRLVSEAFVDLAKEKQMTLQVGQIDDVNFALIPDALEKIMLNLLSNAIKYSKNGGTISVLSVRTKDNELNIRIGDNGIGIPKDRLTAVFERYHRIQDKDTEKISGAGIGLALVKSLIELHHGRIEIDSEVGLGTTIDIYLPIKDEAQQQLSEIKTNDELVAMELMTITGQVVQGPDESIVDSKSAQGKPLVLVIEDNPEMRGFICQAIEQSYRVITAADGEQGVNKAVEQVPDLIISDIMMPHKDGYQVTRELRQKSITNHIPIILLTAKGDRDSRLKGWDEMVDEYLTKPFDAQELNRRLNNLLEIRNILKKRFAANTFNEPPAQEKPYNDQQQQFITKLDGVIENFYTDPGVSIGDFADKMAMSERQLFRKLKSILDVTPAEYLRRFRLERACTLLNDGQSVSFVTFEVGFSTQSYFGKCFKAQYGMSPGEYKKSLKAT